MRKNKLYYVVSICIVCIAVFFVIAKPIKARSSEQDLRQPSGSLDPRDYFPLSIGNSWRYRVTEDGRETVYEYKIDRQLNRGGQVCFEMRAEREGPNPRPMLFAIQEDGIISLAGIYNCEAFDFDSPFMHLPSPLTPGAKWQWKGKGIAFEIVTSFNSYFMGLENCIVPVGKFEDCIKIKRLMKSIGPRDTNIYWFAKDVGLVKMVVRGIGPQTYELISYNLATEE